MGKEYGAEFMKGKTYEEIFGKKRAKEIKKRMSLTRKGKKLTKEHKTKISKALKGRIISEEWKKKISKGRKGKCLGKNNPFYGKHHSKKTKEKIAKHIRGKTYEERYDKEKAKDIKRKQSEALKGEKNPFYGKHHTKKVREAHSKWLKGRFVGKKSHRYGKHLSQETKQKLRDFYLGKTYEELHGKGKAKKIKRKISLKLLGRERPEYVKIKISEAQRGEKSVHWQGGKSLFPYPPEFNRFLKKIIRKRDSYTCQNCGRTQKQTGKLLAIHHINYNKKDIRPLNLISICHSCHSKTNSKRKYWIDYFNKRLRIKRKQKKEEN